MSESNKFTPGPWLIIPGGDEWNQGRIATIEPAPETMLEINYWTVAEVNNRRHESAANARLIAAAPDLLYALEQMIYNEEQIEFESWLEMKSPSGDCESVTSQWKESSHYLDFIDAVNLQIKAIDKARGQK